MKTLVTGGAGFIGSHVSDSLIEAGHDVVILDDLSGGFERNVPSESQFVHGSVCDQALVNNLFDEHRFDHVFHFAAYAPEALSHFIRGFNYQNNVIGSINLINAAIRSQTVKAFVFASSIAVYGDPGAPVDEFAPCIPLDPYGVAKLAIEHDLRAAEDMFGLPFIIFRPHNVYGPRQNLSDPFRNVVGIFFNRAMRNEPLPVFGDGQQTRSFSFISDVAPVIASSITRPEAFGKAFNIGGRESTSLNELAGLISASLDMSPEIMHLPPRHEAKHVSADHTALDSVFGRPTLTSLEVGLKEMAAWAQSMGPQDSLQFNPPVDITAKLPEAYKQILLAQRATSTP